MADEYLKYLNDTMRKEIKNSLGAIDELKARLDHKDFMLAAAAQEQERLKKEVRCLEAGTRTLKTRSQVLENFDNVLLRELLLDIAQAVYTGHFQTTNARFMELRKIVDA